MKNDDRLPAQNRFTPYHIPHPNTNGPARQGGNKDEATAHRLGSPPFFSNQDPQKVLVRAWTGAVNDPFMQHSAGVPRYMAAHVYRHWQTRDMRGRGLNAHAQRRG